MAFAYIASNSAAGSGVTSLDCNLPAGTAAGELLIIAYAFEGVAPGSGPWIIPNIGQLNPNGIGPANAWQQVCWQAPSVAGVGIEVWAAIFSSGTHIVGNFAAAQNVVTVISTYSGEYNPTGLITGAPPRLAPTAQVTGNQPAAPSVAANAGELVIAVGGDIMSAGAFGTPSGFTGRVDATRAGVGTVEATMADRVATVTAATGPITFPDNAASSTTTGATATLVIRPVPAVVGVGNVLTAGMPEDLDLSQGCTVTFTAIDPQTGVLVSGVTVTNGSIWADDASASGTSLESGPFMLVPGPGA